MVLGQSWGSWGVLGESWRVWEGSWARLGGHLEGLGRVLGGLGHVLGPSWDHLGVVLGALGGILGASWARLGGQNRKSRRGTRFLEASWAVLVPSWGSLEAFLASEREPRASKKRSKNPSKFCCMLGSIFRKILVGSGKQNKVKLGPKSIQNRR